MLKLDKKDVVGSSKVSPCLDIDAHKLLLLLIGMKVQLVQISNEIAANFLFQFLYIKVHQF